MTTKISEANIQAGTLELLRGGTVAYATVAQLPLANNDTGSTAFVVENNRLYIWNGSGWFNIALINTSPTITQGPNANYVFETNGTPIVITLIAADPEGIPITWSSQVTSGTLGNTAVISQDNNVFTITPSTDSADAATFGVTFTASDGVNIATAAASFTLVFAAADDYYNQSILLTTSSVNNANNNTFVDSSTNNFAITRVGNTTQGTFSPHSPAGWSGYFDGTGDYLQIPDNVNLRFDADDYTFQTWIYPQSNASSGTLYSKHGVNVSSGTIIIGILSASSGGYLYLQYNLDTAITSSSAVTLNKWTHVAVCRSQNITRLFIDGTLETTVSDSFNQNGNGVSRIGLGRGDGSTSFFTGYISNFHLIKGIALYTSNFAPPTEPLTAIANTSLLTLQDNRFIDRSPNNLTITKFGDTRVVAFSPFLPTVPYDPATHSGSMYFDGTGDYLSAPNNSALDLGSGDYTIEGWWYFTDTSNQALVSKYTASKGYVVQYHANNLRMVLGLGSSDAVYSFAWTAAPNTWNHVAITRSGTSGRAFINGAQIGSTTTFTTSNTVGATTLQIGSTHTISELTRGYVSNFRIVKGTAIYTANFTPPTAPLTAVAGTSLLLNSTNAAIFDETGKVVVETVGDARVSTSVVKYGDSSMFFDGMGDYLRADTSTDLYAFGTGDFTIEMWVYFLTIPSAGTYRVFYDNRAQASAGDTRRTTLTQKGNTIVYFANAGDRITSGVVAANTWYHLALCRSGSSTRMFINGNQAGSTYTDTTNYNNSAQRPYIGGDGDANNSFWGGHISDLRITKGHARYTANFIPPTAKLGYTNAE